MTPRAPARCGRFRFGSRSIASPLRLPLLGWHDVRRFGKRAGPHIDGPLATASALDDGGRVMRQLTDEDVSAIARIANGVMAQQTPIAQDQKQAGCVSRR